MVAYKKGEDTKIKIINKKLNVRLKRKQKKLKKA